MSVLHEAIKRAREARARQGGKSQPSAAAPPVAPADAPRPSLTVRSVRRAPAWIGWLMLFFLLAEGALYLRERNLRLHSEDKMRAAYLQLNDVRGEYLQKSDTVRRSASELRELRTKLDDALRSKTELAKAKQAVEYDNLNKEKNVSELRKQMHEIEMSKYRLQGELYALKAELAKVSSAQTPESASK